MRIITWNVWIGHKPADVRKAIRYFRRRYRPDVIVLQEASRMHGHLNKLGFHVVQGKPQWHPHNVDEAADIAILVTKRHRVRKHGVLKMRQSWKGPKHGFGHPPRQFPFVVVEGKKGKRLHAVLGVHGPFGRSQQAEALGRIEKWLGKGTGVAIRAAAGDWNTGWATVRARTESVGAKQAGHGVDQVAAVNSKKVTKKVLGKHGSDHHAVLVRVPGKRRAGKKKEAA